MQTALYFNQKRFSEKEFFKEKELEDLMFNNGKSLFGQASDFDRILKELRLLCKNRGIRFESMIAKVITVRQIERDF
jgi:hypothetical protein